MVLNPTTNDQRLAPSANGRFARAFDHSLRDRHGDEGGGAVEMVGRLRDGGYRIQFFPSRFARIVQLLGAVQSLSIPSFGIWTRKATPTCASTTVVLRGIPVAVPESSIRSDFVTSNKARFSEVTPDLEASILDVSRMNRRIHTPDGSSRWVPSTSIRLRVARTLGEEMLARGRVVLDYRLTEVYAYTQPIVTCRNCGREGHKTEHCRSRPRQSAGERGVSPRASC